MYRAEWKREENGLSLTIVEKTEDQKSRTLDRSDLDRQGNLNRPLQQLTEVFAQLLMSVRSESEVAVAVENGPPSEYHSDG